MRFLSRELGSRKEVCVLALSSALCSRDSKQPYMKTFSQETVDVFHQLLRSRYEA
jgi:hypothetical protein